MKIIIFEGLPLVGKTTIINYIKNMNNPIINCVDELIIETKELDQDSFMKNDLAKINKYDKGLIFIDKGPISTLSYNEMLNYIKNNQDLNRVKEWFKKEAIPFYRRDDVLTIYLKTKEKKLREKNIYSPHGSIENQIKIEKITITNIKKYCKHYKIVDYNKKEMVGFINEIIDKYM